MTNQPTNDQPMTEEKPSNELKAVFIDQINQLKQSIRSFDYVLRRGELKLAEIQAKMETSKETLTIEDILDPIANLWAEYNYMLSKAHLTNVNLESLYTMVARAKEPQ